MREREIERVGEDRENGVTRDIDLGLGPANRLGTGARLKDNHFQPQRSTLPVGCTDDPGVKDPNSQPSSTQNGPVDKKRNPNMSRDKVFQKEEIKKLFNTINWEQLASMCGKPSREPDNSNQLEDRDNWSENEDQEPENRDDDEEELASWNTDFPEMRSEDSVKRDMLARAKLLRYKMRQAEMLSDESEDDSVIVCQRSEDNKGASTEVHSKDTPETHISKLNVTLGSDQNSPTTKIPNLEESKRREEEERDRNLQLPPPGILEKQKAQQQEGIEEEESEGYTTDDEEGEETLLQEQAPDSGRGAANNRPRRTCQTSLTMTGGDLRLQTAMNTPLSPLGKNKASTKKKNTTAKTAMKKPL